MQLRYILLIKRPFEKAARRIIKDRMRDREQPHKSRFLKEDIDPILEQAWRNFEELRPLAPETHNFGNWHATAIAVYTLAIYRALRSAGVGPSYAIELVSDQVWVFHIPWFPIINAFGFITAGPNPRKRLEKGMMAFATKYWKEPGNRYHFPKKRERAFRINVLRCAMHRFFAQFGREEMELFSKTHCMLDFTVSRALVKGGWYERPNTLSAGHQSCTMFFYAEPEGSEKARPPLPIGSEPRRDIVATGADE